MLVLRPTRFPGPDRHGLSAANKFAAQNVSLSWLFALAYDFESPDTGWNTRVILPADVPQTNFDLLQTLPDDPKGALRRELQKRFGLVAHRETREMDVLRLEAGDSPGPDFKVSAGGNSTVDVLAVNAVPDGRELVIRNHPVSSLARWLEQSFAWRVVDRTGLTNQYDMKFGWQARGSRERQSQEIRQAIRDRLGLKLVPGREPTELLVVEKQSP